MLVSWIDQDPSSLSDASLSNPDTDSVDDATDHLNVSNTLDQSASIYYPLAANERIEYLHPDNGRTVSQFQWKVYDCCRQIPKGRVSTYGSIATYLSSSPRAVGQALKSNCFAPTVPCHRVVAETGFIGGFQGQWGQGTRIGSKVALLQKEGVHIDEQSHIRHWSKTKFDTFGTTSKYFAC